MTQLASLPVVLVVGEHVSIQPDRTEAFAQGFNQYNPLIHNALNQVYIITDDVALRNQTALGVPRFISQLFCHPPSEQPDIPKEQNHKCEEP
jgi:hypothetical protein